VADDEAVPAVSIVGLHGGQWYGAGAEAALRRADTIIGALRQLSHLPADLRATRVGLGNSLDDALDEAWRRAAAGEAVCLVASGDPGFFGLVRLAAARAGERPLAVHPAPSSVALAFARVGQHWDDAVVVSAHGRPLAAAVDAVVTHPKVAVLVSGDQPPQALGRALLDAGCGARHVAVCSKLEQPDEEVRRGDLVTLADGDFDPVSVVVCLAPPPVETRGAGAVGVTWGLPEDSYAHRAGMITKAEVRAVALGKLAIPPAGVFWDVGAGSGSAAVETALLAPGLRTFAIEARSDDAGRLRANAEGTNVTVVHGAAPEALAGLPDPDRAFVGGGGIEVLDAVIRRLRPGGVIVATYASLDRAVTGARRLGQLVQVSINRGVPIGAGGAIRLAAEHPVFVCWGPGSQG